MGDAVDMMIASEYQVAQHMTLRVNQFVTDAVVALNRCCAMSWWLVVASPFLDRSLPGRSKSTVSSANGQVRDHHSVQRIATCKESLMNRHASSDSSNGSVIGLIVDNNLRLLLPHCYRACFLTARVGLSGQSDIGQLCGHVYQY